jgi:hypothetical protein
MKVAMRQIAGSFAQLEKARLVAKLNAARDRRREAHGKCEGRKGYAEECRIPLRSPSNCKLADCHIVRLPPSWRRAGI